MARHDTDSSFRTRRQVEVIIRERAALNSPSLAPAGEGRDGGKRTSKWVPACAGMTIAQLCYRRDLPQTWDDERFDRDGQVELYEMLGSTDKRLHAYPGRHADDGPERSKRVQLFCIAI